MYVLIYVNIAYSLLVIIPRVLLFIYLPSVFLFYSPALCNFGTTRRKYRAYTKIDIANELNRVRISYAEESYRVSFFFCVWYEHRPAKGQG